MRKTDIEHEFKQLRQEEELITKKQVAILLESERIKGKKNVYLPIFILVVLFSVLLLSCFILGLFTFNDEINIELSLDRIIYPKVEITENTTVEVVKHPITSGTLDYEYKIRSKK